MTPEHTRCQCSRCTFRPEQNLTLVALRQSWPNRSDADRRDETEFGVTLDEEGVARLRPVTVVDQLDRLIADWLVGEVE